MTVGNTASVEERIPAVKVLIDLGKGKSYLLYDEIYELLPDDVVSMPSELDQIYQRFGELSISIVDRPERYQNRDDIETIAGFDKKPDDEQAEGYVHAHEKTNDPVRMYLREMGTVPLLDREGEVEIAQRLEQGEWMIYEALCSNPVVLRELLRLNELASKDTGVLRELMESEPDEPLDSKAAERIKKNLEIFKRIAKNDKEINTLRKRQKRYKVGGDKYQEIERQIDRLVGKIARDIRTIDFSVKTRNRLVDSGSRWFRRPNNCLREYFRSLFYAFRLHRWGLRDDAIHRRL